MSKISTVRVVNFKRLSSLDIEPGGRQIVILGGRNAQGKSSALDAIQAALCGAKSIPAEPIKAGEDKGEVTVTLDDGLTIRRTFTRRDDGTFGGTLTVKTADGMSPKGTQGWLDARIGAMTCDPIAFVSKSPKDQADELRRISGVDTTALDSEKARIYTERTDLGRDGKVAAGALESMPHYPDAPQAEVQPEILPLPADVEPSLVSAAVVSAELERARETQRKAEQAAREAAEAQARRQRLAEAAKRAQEAVDEAQRALASARANEEEAARLAGLATSAAGEARSSAIDPTPIAARLAEVEQTNASAMAEARQINAEARARVEATNATARMSAEATNRQVRANVERAKKSTEVEALRAAYVAKTTEIGAIDKKRADLIAAAKMPVQGLGFDDSGNVTLNGIPFSQASRAQQIRVSMAIALAGAPADGIRLALIRDASLLDEESLDLIGKLAEEMDAQVWLERVGDRDPGAIVIEDGGVRR